MATTSKTTIFLLGHPNFNEEGAAAEAITPGHLVNGISSLVKHATADAVGAVAVAHEREEMNKGITDDYAIGDTVKVGVYKPGERFLGIITSGVSVAEGAFLASAGNGTLKAGTAANAIGRSLETIAAATTGNTRIRVEVV